MQPGYAADWLANETGGSYIAFGAGSRLLKANSSDLYPAAPPAALPNASFALGFTYPVEGVAVGDQLVVRPLSLRVDFAALHSLVIMYALGKRLIFASQQYLSVSSTADDAAWYTKRAQVCASAGGRDPGRPLSGLFSCFFRDPAWVQGFRMQFHVPGLLHMCR